MGGVTTNGASVDLLGSLVRADKSWARTHGDEPRERPYLEWLEQHARERVAMEAPDVRLAEVERELTVRSAAADQLGAELETARAQVDRLAGSLRAVEQELELVRDERSRLVDELGEARTRRESDEQAVENVLDELKAARSANQVLRGKLAKATEAGRHIHRYPAPGPGLLVGPCECGQPYPRYFEEVDEGPEAVPDVEPWADLFDRIRAEVDAPGAG